jgi:hypothetical protein
VQSHLRLTWGTTRQTRSRQQDSYARARHS